jgi:uncharacterized tellurite resistance protein B-like protein
MDFDQTEKLAVVKTIVETIGLDDQYNLGELMYMNKLMSTLDFDAHFIEKAKKLKSVEAVSILRGMSEDKKKALIIMVDEMTEADGMVHPKETEFFVNLLNTLT